MRKVVTFFPANGFLITLRIRSITSQIVHTCLTSWLATSMDGQIWGTSTGDGSPTIAI